MKTDILKKLIKDAVKEAIHEEMKEILLEAIKSNKQPLRESYQPTNDDKTLKFDSNSVTKTPIDSRKAYMEILEDMHKGPETGLTGEFRVTGPIDTMSEGSALPQGQLGLDAIMGLIKK